MSEKEGGHEGVEVILKGSLPLVSDFLKYIQDCIDFSTINNGQARIIDVNKYLDNNDVFIEVIEDDIIAPHELEIKNIFDP
jgi:hypothetical protein